MPVSLSYPGVYVEEIPSGVRTITGVSTSVTAFIGRALMGPVNEPVLIHSFTEYERMFGGLWVESAMSISVQQYFANGGADAIIVRVVATADATANPARTASTTATVTINGFVFAASSPGSWANGLTVEMDATNTADRTTPPHLFNLTVSRGAEPLETLRNLTVDPLSGSFAPTVLAQRSAYVRVTTLQPPSSPLGPPGTFTVPPDLASPPNVDESIVSGLTSGGTDGSQVIYAEMAAALDVLDRADIFNLLCLPPPISGATGSGPAYQSAATKCAQRRAMLIVDPPPGLPPSGMSTSTPTFTTDQKRASAIFYPWIKAVHPLKVRLGIIEEFPPSGAVAGVFARTDTQRGVWKAPAGVDAGLANVQGLAQLLTDPENGDLNKLGINCLRNFTGFGNVVWGSRTLDGDDRIGSEWKYIPVRRTAYFIEESLFRGLKWVVFEPNAAPLWAQIRLNVGAFMNNLFRQGAFQGVAPKDAYFVKCDGETTTQNDINLGIVNILVGFAPLKPAEFVILKIQQMAGQIAV
jgi:phage tail sheath protein FI